MLIVVVVAVVVVVVIAAGFEVSKLCLNVIMDFQHAICPQSYTPSSLMLSDLLPTYTTITQVPENKILNPQPPYVEVDQLVRRGYVMQGPHKAWRMTCTSATRIPCGSFSSRESFQAAAVLGEDRRWVVGSASRGLALPLDPDFWMMSCGIKNRE
jgi:hypothetical protein